MKYSAGRSLCRFREINYWTQLRPFWTDRIKSVDFTNVEIYETFGLKYLFKVLIREYYRYCFCKGPFGGRR